VDAGSSAGTCPPKQGVLTLFRNPHGTAAAIRRSGGVPSAIVPISATSLAEPNLKDMWQLAVSRFPGHTLERDVYTLLVRLLFVS
jgi:hypothetical protein